MMKKQRLAAWKAIKIIAGSGLIFISGCEKTKEALGLTRLQPDEFRVVTRSPLYTPPHPHLKQPEPGKPAPFTVSAFDKAKNSLGVTTQTEPLSVTEKKFLKEAQVASKLPTIRQDLLKEENPSMKPDPWAEKLFPWQKSAQEKGDPLDAEKEYQRLQKEGYKRFLKEGKPFEGISR